MPTNFQRKLQSGAPLFGVAVSLADLSTSEMLGHAGFDFLWIDMEHTALTKAQVLPHLVAASSAGAASFVRVPANDPVLVKPILDMGPDGVIFPCIRSAADAQLAVQACEYPPRGIRGVGPRRAVRYGADDVVGYMKGRPPFLKIIQMEHADVLERLDEIARVPGVDAWLVGPSDLSASLGHLGDDGAPSVQSAIDAICEAARRHGLLVGAFTGDNPGALARWAERGVRLFTIGGDTGYLMSAARRSLQQAGEAVPS